MGNVDHHPAKGISRSRSLFSVFPSLGGDCSILLISSTVPKKAPEPNVMVMTFFGSIKFFFDLSSVSMLRVVFSSRKAPIPTRPLLRFQ